MKKYLAARPETICSILHEGKLPQSLPTYLRDHQLYFFDTPQEAALNSSTNLHQTFIVQCEAENSESTIPDLTFPKKRSLDQGKQDLSFHDEFRLLIETIEQVICYSERGEKTLRQLLKNHPHPTITIDPDRFSCKTSTAHRSALDETSSSPAPKQARNTLSDNASTTFSPTTLIHRRRPTTLVRRLSTPAEHIDLLKQALAKAEKSLLITSYDISHQALEQINFYDRLEQILIRGVKVYIYYNDCKGADEQALQILDRFPHVKCDEAFTHSKFLCVDDQWVCIGSFNWLSSIKENYIDEQIEGSLVSYQHDLNKDLLHDIWDHLRFYRNLQFENYRAAYSFERSERSYTTVIYELEDQSTLEYIPSLDQHCGFLQDMLAQAKHKVVICSPFLSMRQFLADANQVLLRSLVNRRVSLFILTSNHNSEYQQLVQYLSRINCTYLHVINNENFHLKTVIIDDEIIAEGSFNWLSAVRNEESTFHNHEATLLVRGNAADELVQQFYTSPIGQQILMKQSQIKATQPDYIEPYSGSFQLGRK